jgi:glycosyltransferase involved in cell wall biosynthesis
MIETEIFKQQRHMPESLSERYSDGKLYVSRNNHWVQGVSKTNIVCFGGEDWWYKNRGHIDMQLMRRFAKMGITLYVNSIVMQKPKLTQGRKFVEKLLRKMKSTFIGLKNSDAGFWVYSPFTLPVHHLAWARPINELILRYQVRRVVQKLSLNDPVIWVACPAACDTAMKMKKRLLVYQRTDRFEEYPNVEHSIIKKYDEKLKASADLTLFVNSMLFKEEHEQCKNSLFLDHGVDYHMFATAEQNPYIPEDLAGVKKPVVGFFGAIDDHTFDIPFVENLVDLLPHMSFVFVGEASSDITNLQKKVNVWFLGYKSYEQIPHYGKCFDIAIMPWRENRWIEACNPIKLKEYLSLGKPIVSTPFPELKKYLDVVCVAETPEIFAECIEKSLAEDNPDRIIVRRKMVEKATWESKAQLVLKELFGKETDF